MRMWIRSSTVSRVSGAVVALWLCGTGSAWAGGSADVGGVQAVLDTLCGALGTSCAVPLPPLPTITEQVLEISGLSNTPPNATRKALSICDFTNGPTCSSVVVNAANQPTQPPVLPKLTSAASCASAAKPSQICPLGFIDAETSSGQAAATAGKPAADTFFYAVTTGPTNGQPDTLRLVYDHLTRTIPVFLNGGVVADISLPLVELLSDPLGSERVVAATLEVSATCTGGVACLKATVIGDFTGSGTPQRLGPADLGLTFTATFGPSPNSTVPHTIFEVDGPLLMNNVNDPPYYSPPGGVFSATNPGVSFGSAFIGAAPDAARFAASFSNSVAGPFAIPVPGVNAYLAIAINGATFVSAPLPSP